MKKPNSKLFGWLWFIWWIYFAVVEYLGVKHEQKTGSDDETDTHFIAEHIPYWMRIPILGWLTYHFLVQHRKEKP